MFYPKVLYPKFALPAFLIYFPMSKVNSKRQKVSRKVQPTITIIIHKLVLPPGSNPEDFANILSKIGHAHIDIKSVCEENVELTQGKC